MDMQAFDLLGFDDFGAPPSGVGFAGDLSGSTIAPVLDLAGSTYRPEAGEGDMPWDLGGSTFEPALDLSGSRFAPAGLGDLVPAG